MLGEARLAADAPSRPAARLTLVVEEVVAVCLYCEEELTRIEDLWCLECEEIEEPAD